MRASMASNHTLPSSRTAGVSVLQPPVLFVNLAGDALTIVGPVSGRRYHFAQRGSQVQIDARDRPLLSKLRQLRQVR